MPSLSSQFWDAWHPPADPTHLSFHGKTVLVTGGNSGLGFQAAVKFARQGASRLILGVRSREKGEEAKTSILNQTRCTAQITIMTVDLSTFDSVKEFARQVREESEQLHVVVLCAGVMMPRFALSAEGYELNLQINVLSTALLACLLLPELRETGAQASSQDPAHLCFLNSLATQEFEEKWIAPGQSLLERIGDSSQFDHVSQYYLVKLAARYFVQGLAATVGDQDNVVVNCCCPGMCNGTNLHQYYDLITRMILVPYKLLCGRSAEQGARTVVSAAGLGRESHGKLWLHDELPPPAMFMATERSQILGLETFDHIMSIIRERAYLE
ncbi:short-chain dehydrogenase/reductase [Xylariaceae sp. FL0804]|nr:short-chain dehydrogenase/reductase [Xylariaceae sp. FL0804]